MDRIARKTAHLSDLSVIETLKIVTVNTQQTEQKSGVNVDRLMPFTKMYYSVKCSNVKCTR